MLNDLIFDIKSFGRNVRTMRIKWKGRSVVISPKRRLDPMTQSLLSAIRLVHDELRKLGVYGSVDDVWISESGIRATDKILAELIKDINGFGRDIAILVDKWKDRVDYENFPQKQCKQLDVAIRFVEDELRAMGLREAVFFPRW